MPEIFHSFHADGDSYLAGLLGVAIPFKVVRFCDIREIMISQNPPEPGQLVLVRQRHFVVTDVRKSGLPENILHPNGSQSQHLVSLLSVEDEGLGEELQVIWELEPGAQVYEKFSLPEPTGFDDPRLLDAFIDAVRWGAVSSADIRSLQAPFRSGIDIEDYGVVSENGK